MLSSLIATLVLLQVQEPARDFTLPIMTIQEFGDWVGKETGEKVIVSADVADRNVYIHLKQRTLTELIGFVEKAVGLKVLRENGAVTLLPAPVKANEKAFTFFEKNVNELGEPDLTAQKMESAIKSIVAINERRARGEVDQQRDWKEIRSFERFDPVHSEASALLRALGPQGLLSIPDGHRVVYSTHPTRLQRRWPLNVDQRLNTINKLCAQKNDLVNKLIPQDNSEDDGPEFRSSSYNSEMTSPYGSVDEPVKAMMFVVTPEFPYYYIELRLYAEDGHIVSSSGFYFQAQDDESERDEEDDSDVYTSLPGQIDLTPEEQAELQQVTLLYNADWSEGGANENSLSFLATIDTRNPLSGAVSKVFDYGCEATNTELVREVFDGSYWTDEPKVSAEEAAYTVFNYETKEYKDELVVMEPPSDVLQLREAALPRRALAAVARAALGNKVISIDALADAVALLPNRKQVHGVVSVATKLSGQSTGSMSEDEGYSDEFALEVYSRLNGQQRAAVKSPGGLVLEMGRVSQQLQWLFDDEMLNRELEFSIDYSEEMTEADMALAEASGTWRGEQTVYLAEPDAWPARIKLEMTPEETAMVRMVTPDYTYNQVMDPEQIAWSIIDIERSKDDPEYQNVTYTYAPATKVNLQMKMMFGKYPVYGGQFEMLAKPGINFGPFEKLPQAFRAKVDNFLKEYRDQIGDGG